MAAAMGGGGDGRHPDDHFDPPKTPRMMIVPEAQQNLRPDTEANVAEQTDGIFRNFVHQMYELQRTGVDADNTPSMPELTAFTNAPFEPATRVGRRLALIGDEINARHAAEFQYQISRMNLTTEHAYEAFAGVASKMFKDGKINWGRIITLLCFGYQLAVHVLERGFSGFFSEIVSFVIKFVISERIAKWIAEQGGWLAALGLVPESLGWKTLGAIAGVAAVSVFAAIFLSKK